MRRWGLTLAAVCAVWGIWAPGASATTYEVGPIPLGDQEVSNTDGICTLREAVTAANTDAAYNECPAGTGPDTIRVASGVYLFAPLGRLILGDMGPGDTLTIERSGSDTAFLWNPGGGRVIEITAGSAGAAIDGVAITGGFEVGGIGGGIFVGADTNLSLSESVVYDNHAWSSMQPHGGGIGMANDLETTVRLTNVTLSDNDAQGHGGAIYAGTSGTLVMDGVTITNNEAGISTITPEFGDAGGVHRLGGRLEMHNTIISGNRGHAGKPQDCFHFAVGTVVNTGGNVIGDPTLCSFEPTATDQIGNPLLEPLADNGGATFTHAISPGSMAIDAGTAPCLPTDQRGLPRPSGASCDSGAFEFQVPPPDPAVPAQLPVSPSTNPPPRVTECKKKKSKHKRRFAEAAKKKKKCKKKKKRR